MLHKKISGLRVRKNGKILRLPFRQHGVTVEIHSDKQTKGNYGESAPFTQSRVLTLSIRKFDL
jgi:hypothetical protein